MGLLFFLLLAQDAARPPWETRKLAEIPAELDYLEARFTPDLVVYEAKKGENFLYVAGNAVGQEFDCVEDLVIASAGPLFAYRGQRGKKRFLVTPSGMIEEDENPGRPRISPDGKRLAYAVHEKDEEFIVVDGRRGPSFVRVHSPVFSPDSATIAYTAERRKPGAYGERVIVRGEEILPTPYEVLWDPVFHPDGKTLVYPAKRGDSCFLVVGGKEAPSEFGFVGNAVFSRDGKHVAYSAFKDGNHMLVLDHDPVGGTFGFNVGEYGFSPDGRLYYQHWRYNWPNVTLDGKDLQPAGQSAGTPEFSADGRHMTFIADRDGKEAVCLDGKVVFEGGRFNHLVLSPDGRTPACAEWTGGVFVEVEEKVTRGSMARRVWRGGQSWIRFGSKRSEAFDEVWQPVFSADSKWIGFGARKGRVLSWQVIKVE